MPSVGVNIPAASKSNLGLAGRPKTQSGAQPRGYNRVMAKSSPQEFARPWPGANHRIRARTLAGAANIFGAPNPGKAQIESSLKPAGVKGANSPKQGFSFEWKPIHFQELRHKSPMHFQELATAHWRRSPSTFRQGCPVRLNWKRLRPVQFQDFGEAVLWGPGALSINRWAHLL